MENYHVQDLIGEGSFGKVFKGRRKSTGQIVALKFIPKLGKTLKEIHSLKQEVSILCNLRHENIVLLLDSIETDQEFVVVMEFALGELFEVLEDDRCLPEAQIKQISAQLVRALYYLHSNRIIHRDMKPQNILIGANGTVKVCDFGFARAMSRNTVVLTSIKGTPLYMAPELVQEQPYNHSSDLWSLGIILYELFVGQPPFYSSNIYSLIHMIVKNPVNYPSGMSEQFKSFLKGLLHKQPQHRMPWPEILSHPWIRDAIADLGHEHVYSLPMHALQIRRRLPPLFNAGFEQMFDEAYATNRTNRQEMNPPSKTHKSRKHRNGDDAALRQPPSQARSPSPRQPHRHDAFATKTASDQASQFVDDHRSHVDPESPRQQQLVQKYTTAAPPPSYGGQASPHQKKKKSKSLSNSPGELHRVEDIGKALTSLISRLSRSKEALSTDLVSDVDIAISSIANVLESNKTVSISSELFQQLPKLALQLLYRELAIQGLAIAQATLAISRDIKAQVSGMPILPSAFVRILCSDWLPSLKELLRDDSQQRGKVRAIAASIITVIFRLCGSIPTPPDRVYTELISLNISADLAKLIGDHGSASRTTEGCLEALSAIIHPEGGAIHPFPLGRVIRPSKEHQTTSAINSYSLKHKVCIHVADVVASTKMTVATIGYILAQPQHNSVIPALKVTLQAMRISKDFLGIWDISCKSDGIQSLWNLATTQNHVVQCLALGCLSSLLESGSHVLRGSQLTSAALSDEHVSVLLDFISQDTGIIKSYAAILLAVAVEREGRIPEGVGHVTKALLRGGQAVSAIRDIFSGTEPTPTTTISDIEGSGFGVMSLGCWDGFVLLVNQAVVSFPEQGIAWLHQTEMSSTLCKAWGETLPVLMDNLSPPVMLILVDLICRLLQSSPTKDELLVGSPVFASCCVVIESARVRSLAEYPEGLGGGLRVVRILVSQVVDIVTSGIGQVNSSVQTNAARRLHLLQQELLNGKLIKHLLVIMGTIPGVADKVLPLLSMLVLALDNFASQYIRYDGLSNKILSVAFEPSNPAQQAVEMLVLVAHLARISPKNYDAIQKSSITRYVKPLMLHSNSAVRAKACNLVGNLCRHNSTFYQKLDAEGIVHQLVVCCSDPDSATRKFASFAIGNASFHDATLYKHLAPCIPTLVAMLSEADEKIRCNAAGALGNLARNDNKLCDVLLRADAPKELIRIAGEDGKSCKCIALFALGNFCAHSSLKEAMLANSLGELLNKVKKDPDPSVQKYVKRISQKLGQD